MANQKELVEKARTLIDAIATNPNVELEQSIKDLNLLLDHISNHIATLEDTIDEIVGE